MENEKVVNYLLDCGVKPQIKGFRYLYEAIVMTIKNNNEMPKLTKIIYPTVGKKYKDSASKVERACRHAISTSKKEFKFMTNGEFIANACIKIKFTR